MTRHTCPFCKHNVAASAMHRPTKNDAMQCRSHLQCLTRLLKRHRKMAAVGQLMSNLCFNLAQKQHPDAETMGNLWREWDEVRKVVDA